MAFVEKTETFTDSYGLITVSVALSDSPVYRFGNKNSPFLLNVTIKYHLQKYPNSEAVQELRENLYVDDLSGADSVEEGQFKRHEAQSILAAAGMSLSMWVSNNKSLMENVYDPYT